MDFKKRRENFLKIFGKQFDRVTIACHKIFLKRNVSLHRCSSIDKGFALIFNIQHPNIIFPPKKNDMNYSLIQNLDPKYPKSLVNEYGIGNADDKFNELFDTKYIGYDHVSTFHQRMYPKFRDTIEKYSAQKNSRKRQKTHL